MKVVCINDLNEKGEKIYNLTKGKTYDVLNSWIDGNKNKKIYIILDDIEYTVFYDEQNLMPLQQWREIQLNKLEI